MSTAEEMSCQELVELVTDYLEDALSPEDRARFEAHLETCPHCVIYVDQIRTTVLTLGRLPEEELSDEAHLELMGAFRGWKQAGPADR